MSPERDTIPPCPLCRLPGHAAMIPAPLEPGDRMPRVRLGIRYECGTTEEVQSRLCATIVERMQRSLGQERERFTAAVVEAVGLLELGEVEDAVRLLEATMATRQERS